MMLAYDLDNDVVLLRSPVTGHLHAFDAECLLEFVDWLRAADFLDRPFGDFQVHNKALERKLAVVFPVGPGRYEEVVAFNEASFHDEVETLNTAVYRFVDEVYVPVQEMVRQGMTREQIAQEMDRRHLFELPLIWRRDG